MAETVLAKLAVQIAANTAEFNKALNRTEANFKSFTGGITKLAGTLGVAFGVEQVASFAFEVAKLAGEAEGVRNAFERLPNAVRVMEQMKEATGGTVSELELMKAAVQANNFQIPVENLSKLFQFATLRAQQTGQSVDYLVQSIILGIGRKSPLILDNLGISAVRLREKLKGASAEASTIGDVAKVVGDIAGEELGNIAGFSENTATKVQRLNAEWENFKVQIGNAANGTTLFGEALNGASLLLKNLTTFLQSDASNALQSYLKLVTLVPRSLLKGANATLEFVNELNSLETAVSNFNKQFGSELFAGVFENTEQYNNQLKDIEEKAKKAGVKILLMKDEVTGFTRAVIDSRTKIPVLTGTVEKHITTLETLREKQKQLIDDFDKTDEADKKKLSNIGNEIIKTQDLIEELEKYRKKQKEVNDLRKVDPIQNVGGLLQTAQAFNTVQENAKKATEEIGKFILSFNPVAKLPEKVDVPQWMKDYVAGLDQAKVEIEEKMIDISGVVSSGIASLAESIGAAFATQNFSNFGKNLIDAVASFAQQLGGLMIASGVGILALRSGNPAAMIAGGAALVAVGAAIKSTLSKTKSFPNPSVGGGGGGSFSSQTERFSNPGGEQRIIFEGQFVAQGNQLVAVLNNENTRMSRLNG